MATNLDENDRLALPDLLAKRNLEREQILWLGVVQFSGATTTPFTRHLSTGEKISFVVHILDEKTNGRKIQEAKPEMRFPFICKSKKMPSVKFQQVLPLGFDKITKLNNDVKTSFHVFDRIYRGNTVSCVAVVALYWKRTNYSVGGEKNGDKKACS